MMQTERLAEAKVQKRHHGAFLCAEFLHPHRHRGLLAERRTAERIGGAEDVRAAAWNTAQHIQRPSEQKVARKLQAAVQLGLGAPSRFERIWFFVRAEDNW